LTKTLELTFRRSFQGFGVSKIQSQLVGLFRRGLVLLHSSYVLLLASSFIFQLVDEHPLLWQTGYKHLYPHVKAAVDRILSDRGGMKALKYVSFSHVEADECGSLDFVLKGKL
jgi:hypothetical protein